MTAFFPKLQLELAITSTPANGKYYVEGETVTGIATVTNIGNPYYDETDPSADAPSDVTNITVYLPATGDEQEISNPLSVGGSASVSIEYYVTEVDANNELFIICYAEGTATTESEALSQVSATASAILNITEEEPFIMDSFSVLDENNRNVIAYLRDNQAIHTYNSISENYAPVLSIDGTDNNTLVTIPNYLDGIVTKTKNVLADIIKTFSDVSTKLNLKLDKSNVANNLTTTVEGYALDARQGKALNSALSNEIAARQETDASLQSQISQIIAPSGEAPSAAEVQNARIGADGITYSTLGEAIRVNDTKLKNQIDDLDDDIETASSNVTRLTERVGTLENEVTTLAFSNVARNALLNCFQHVAWIDDQGMQYYTSLQNALNVTLDSIVAVYTKSGTVYDTSNIEDLRPDIVVTGYYSDGTSRVVTGYTLSGTLVAGTSTITVTFGGKTTTFTVTVTHMQGTLYSISAVLDPNAVITTENTLEDLRQYLTVTAHYSTGENVIVNGYTLSGSMNIGQNTITVEYSNKTTTFTVTVIEAPHITAVFNASGNTIYSDDLLDSLKQYLTVTYYNEGTQTVIDDNDYTLAGTLVAGTSTITVNYENYSTQFTAQIMDESYRRVYPSAKVTTYAGGFTRDDSFLDHSNFVDSQKNRTKMLYGAPSGETKYREMYVDGVVDHSLEVDFYPFVIPPNAKSVFVEFTPSTSSGTTTMQTITMTLENGYYIANGYSANFSDNTTINLPVSQGRYLGIAASNTTVAPSLSSLKLTFSDLSV